MIHRHRLPIRWFRSGRFWLMMGLIACSLIMVAQVIAFADGEAATLVLGQPDFSSSAPGVLQMELNLPGNATVDPVSKKVFVADTSNNRVLRFASATTLTNGAPAEAVLGQPSLTSTMAGTSQTKMSGPGGLAMDTNGTLWVGDQSNNRVLRFDQAATKPTGAAADGVLGQPTFTDQTPGTSQTIMHAPKGVAIDGHGTLWVADSENCRVLRFDQAATKVNGAPADGVLGQSTFATNLRDLTQYNFDRPLDIAIAIDGTLWVADTYNSRVLRFDQAATKPNGALADGVLGQPNFTSNPLIKPISGVTVDTAGTLWAVDTYRNRVLSFTNAATKPNGAPADGVLGQPSFAPSSPATSQTGMRYPIDASIDSDNRLWIADASNNRVLRFGGEPAATPTAFVTPTATATPPVATPTTTATGTPISVQYHAYVPLLER